jgi:predicted metal-dependent hydrolase
VGHFTTNQRYLQFLGYFHYSYDYFECHEVLEEQWKCELNESFKPSWLGLIRLSVVLYHQRRGNLAGATKLMRHVVNFANNRILVEQVGLNFNEFIKTVQLLKERIDHNLPFIPISLPIENKALENNFHRIKEQFTVFEVVPDSIVHKHALRDRTEVINEREKNLLVRHQMKEEH